MSDLLVSRSVPVGSFTEPVFIALASAATGFTTETSVVFKGPRRLVAIVPSIVINGAAAGGGLRAATLQDIVAQLIDNSTSEARSLVDRAESSSNYNAATAILSSESQACTLDALAAVNRFFNRELAGVNPSLKVKLRWIHAAGVCENTIVTLNFITERI